MAKTHSGCCGMLVSKLKLTRGQANFERTITDLAEYWRTGEKKWRFSANHSFL
ncbi:hypothetical protein GCM10011446_33380 [Acinetobacter vivianii]|nr:hypothetical protein GCM10011446_33380 [Acinetobacter vivianii]